MAYDGSLVQAGAIPDSREVTITRNGARSPGKVYSPDGQLHGEYVDETGIGHGETTYSYFYGIRAAGSSPTLTPNWLTFNAVLSGTWTQKDNGNLLAPGSIPDVTWTWSPTESQDTWNTATCEMPQGGITYFGDGSSSGTAASPAPYPITYTATDNGDKATAGASYALTVHEQWDNLRLDPSHPFDVVDNDVPVVIDRHYISQENDANSATSPIGPISVAFTVSAGLSIQLSGSFKIGDFFTLGGNFQPSASLSGTVGEQITGAPIQPDSYVELYFHTHYHTNHWFVDHYTPGGYDQTYTQLIDTSPDIAELHWKPIGQLPL